MEIAISIVDGIFKLLQAIVFGAVVVACFAIVMKYKSKQPRNTVQVEVVPQQVSKSDDEDDDEEMIDLITGEVLRKGKKNVKVSR